jgi:hypothetical protein
MRPEERETITPGNLPQRFGWQGEGQIQFLDDEGNPLSPAQWEERLQAKRESLADEREEGR